MLLVAHTTAMKPITTAALLASSALPITVRANFTIFYDVTAYDAACRFLDEPFASCDQINKTTRYVYADDLSGDHLGCHPSGGSDNHTPDVLEANTLFGHFTVDGNRNFDIYDDKDRNRGHCTRDGQYYYNCQSPETGGSFNGVSMFDCSTDYFIGGPPP